MHLLVLERRLVDPTCSPTTVSTYCFLAVVPNTFSAPFCDVSWRTLQVELIILRKTTFAVKHLL